MSVTSSFRLEKEKKVGRRGRRERGERISLFFAPLAWRGRRGGEKGKRRG